MSDKRDFSATLKTFVILWGIPILLLWGLFAVDSGMAQVTRLSLAAFIMTWMGAWCLANAWSCRRLHCFFTGPMFLIAAFTMILMAHGRLSIGPDGPAYVLWICAVGVALGFLLEAKFGKYAGGER